MLLITYVQNPKQKLRVLEGHLIVPGKPTNFVEEFKRVISLEPKRKGKPKLASPEEMKAIWRTTV